MRKFLVIAIPIVTLAIFILVMLSDNVLKKPIQGNDDVPRTIQSVKQAVSNDKWDLANSETDKLASAWKKVVKRVQFSAEKDEINSFDVNLARLRGAIMARDKSSSFMELNEAYEHWEDIGK